MGYTHYWYKNYDVAEAIYEEKYQELFPIARRILEIAGRTMKLEVTFYANAMKINGDDESGCEDFLWFSGKSVGGCIMMENQKFPNAAFNFCKTRQLEYDLPVVAILCAIQNIYGEELVSISSDGDMNGEDWEEGRRLYEEVIAEL